MSSFLCFICHSTVNADTNEDMREKYREVVGMHLCPDSHLCHICCHVLNKLSMFRAVCLKRSLEYPVLFSEKGTLNLQRNDMEFLTLCPEESCGHYYNRNTNSKTFNLNFSYYQNDNDNLDDYNQYQQNDLISNVNDYFNYEEQMFDTNFNLQLQNLQQNTELQTFPDCVDSYSNTSTDYTQNNESDNDFDRNIDVRKDLDVRKDIDVQKEVRDLDIRREDYTQLYSCREEELKQFVLYKNSFNCFEKPYENHNYEIHNNNQLNQDVNINDLRLNNVNVYDNQNVSCLKQNYSINQQEKREIANELMHEFSTHELTTLQCRNSTSCMEWGGNTFKNYNLNESNVIQEGIFNNLITKDQNIVENVTNNLEERNLYTSSDYCLTELVQMNKNVIPEGNLTLFNQTNENHHKTSDNNVIIKLQQTFSSNLESQKDIMNEIDTTILQDKDVTITSLENNLKKSLINLHENKTDDQKISEEASENKNEDEVIRNKNDDELTENQNNDEVIENQNNDEVIENQDNDEVIENQNNDEFIENQNNDEVIENQNNDEVIGNQNDEIESIENSISSPTPSEIGEQTNTRSEVDENDIEAPEKSDEKHETIEKGFIKIVLTVKEQKAELEANRKDKKYLDAEFKCYNCALGFIFKDTYQAHMMRHEESNGEHKCSVCSLRFASIRVSRAHRAAHAHRYQCAVCGRCVRATRRTAHKRLCHVRDTAACHICGKLFQDSSGLQQHLKRVHQATTSRHMQYACNVCGETFNKHAALRTHMLSHLTKKFPCPSCPAVFKCPFTLNQHTKRHTHPTGELHHCITCNLSYTTRKSLRAHQRNALAHQNNIQECPVCGRACPNQTSLRTHIESVHSHANNYACSMCPKRYTNKKSLVRHLKGHNGRKETKNAVCHICGSVIKTISKLKRHLREICEKTKLEEELAELYRV